MAQLRTEIGLVVSYDDNWISIDLTEDREEGFFFFRDLYPSISQRGLHWWGQETRLDEQGREWRRKIPLLVIDDFGSLVEVPA